MFGKDKKIANEKVLYEARPSFILSCTSVFIAVIVLGILFYAYTEGIKMIGGMGMYLIDSVKMPITSYYALAILILMIFTFLYMVWKVLSWATVKYTITSYRVIVKKGILTENKTYMPFNTIQDVNLSQNILGKLISVGTLSLYSAYDGKNVELKNIFSPSKVEDIIFKNMRGASYQSRNYYNPMDNNYNNPNNYNNRNSENVKKSGGILSVFGKKKENHTPVRNYGNIYDNNYNNPNDYNDFNSPNYDEIVPEHNHARSDAPINDIDDLDDLELVDVNERKKELRNLRRQAKAQNNRKHYNKSNYHNNHSNYNNHNNQYNNNNHSNYNNPNYSNNPNYQPNHNQNKHNQYNNYEPSNYNPNRVGGCLPEDWENDGYNDYNNYVDYVAGPSYYNNQERNATTNNQYNQNQNIPNQDYADVYIQDAQDGVTYEPIHNDSIRDSYKRNPDKYFAENYEKFQEDNLKSQVREANNSANNSNNKNIMFRDQKPKSYDNNLANEFVSDVPNTYNDPNNQYNNPNNYNNYNNSDYNNQPNYNPNYGLDDYKKEYANNPQYSDNRNNMNNWDNRNDMNYNDSNYSDYRNNQNRGYNKNYNGNKKYNPNKRYNKNKKYNKHNKHNKYKHNNYNNHNGYNNRNGHNNYNNQYNNQYNHDNYNHNNDYGDYGYEYDSGDNLDLKNNKRTAKDVIKNHSKKFER
ncbi:MAG: PH domain-containing protein [archaeon]|nr:PH domain-containing protein [archaeon]